MYDVCMYLPANKPKQPHAIVTLLRPETIVLKENGGRFSKIPGKVEFRCLVFRMSAHPGLLARNRRVEFQQSFWMLVEEIPRGFMWFSAEKTQ